MASVTLTPGRELSDDAADALAELVNDHPGGIRHLSHQLLTRAVTIWAASIDGAAAGWMVTKETLGPDGVEFWILFAVGGAPRSPIAPACLEAIEAHAKSKGCVRVVFWTQRPGLARIAEARGYGITLVCQKEV
jgi:hypothetical protein